ncbi:hypothetical protein FACS1894125_3570 [Actinomycetota bacterium]|nr:hypothetical protein FACS1894125_3570 [Actinomycetota bacterium]
MIEDVTLDQLRAEIDAVDDDILMLLSRRFSLTEEVGKLKAEQNLDPLDSGREAKQYKRLRKLREDLDLPKGLEKDLWATIMNYSKNRHEEIAGLSW